jgi:hypothetical protein
MDREPLRRRDRRLLVLRVKPPGKGGASESHWSWVSMVYKGSDSFMLGFKVAHRASLLGLIICF